MSSKDTYVLCEFVNEQKKDGDETQVPVEAVYSEWVNLHSNETIKDLILSGKVVSILWPNVPVKPRGKIATKTPDGKEVEWKPVAAQLKAENKDWVLIKQALNNLIMHNNTNPDPKSRKDRARVRDNAQQASTSTVVVKTSTKARKTSKGNKKQLSLKGQPANMQPRNMDSSNTEDEAQVDNPPPCKKSKKAGKHIADRVFKETKKKKRDDVTSSDEDEPLSMFKVCAKTKKQKKKCQKYKKSKINGSSSNSDSSETSVVDSDGSTMDAITMSKGELAVEISNLRMENKLLRQENARLRARAMDSIVTMEKLVEMCKSTSASCFPPDSENQKNIVFGFEKNKTLIPSAVENDCNQTLDPLTLNSPFPETLDDTDSFECKENIRGLEEKQLSSLKISSPDQKNQKLLLASENCTAVANEEDENVKTEKFVYFGSKAVLEKQLKTARHKKPSILAAELTALVFTAEEMALSTLKGKKTNAYANSFQKRTLDEEKVDSIVQYVAQHFCKTAAEITDEVKKSIANKLNNFSAKTEEGKKIIAAERRKLGLPTASQQPTAGPPKQATQQLEEPKAEDLSENPSV